MGIQIASGFPVCWSGMTALAIYYGLYEYLHWCMHTPAGRWIERTACFGIWTRATDSTISSGA
jgi:hypothetical protein